MALSTVSNLRGFDMSDCTLLIYDEFIPEPHERPLKNEAAALFNAYENQFADQCAKINGTAKALGYLPPN